MTKLKPDEKVSAWKGGSAVERINSCRAMLFLHGFLTDGESKKVMQRMEAWLESCSQSDQAASGDPKHGA